MNKLLKQLHKAGVHGIKSNKEIILEVLEDQLHNEREIDVLLYKLLMNVKGQKLVIFQCPHELLAKLDNIQKMMTVEGERVIYIRSLAVPIEMQVPSFEIWPATEEKSISFFAEVMGKSVQDAHAFLNAMKEELPTQVDNMFTVYLVNGKPAGIVLPHIEPDADREGRMFWIGLHPSYRGKGLGKNLHMIGLYRLQKEFKAKSYLGSTQIDNYPMRNIMAGNGCIERNIVISLKYPDKNI